MPRSVYYNEFGGPEVLQIGEVPAMPTGPDCVVVRTAGAGINPVDWKIMRGYLQPAIEAHFPIVPGWDIAGEVVATGPAVTELAPGDRVYGYARLDAIGHGTAAEQVTLPVRTLARAPESLDLVSAAAIPLAGLTALQLIRRLAPQPGETVLIHNGSGGVGQFAVQLARLSGARVIATASERNHEHLRALGCEPVQYGSGLVDAVRALAPEGVDVIADLIGGDALAVSQSLATEDARFGSITDAQEVLALGGVYVFVRPSAADLTQLAMLVDAGEVVVDVAATYPFEQAATAYRELEQGHVRGKIVLTP